MYLLRKWVESKLWQRMTPEAGHCMSLPAFGPFFCCFDLV